jgi:GTP cyclohydrolase IA
VTAVRRVLDQPNQDLPEIARSLLFALGEDPDREGLADTPRRVAESLTFLTQGYEMDPRAIVEGALFEHQGHDVVVVRDIPVYSLCEHHLLPFFGRAHIAYLPAGKVIGLSKLSRLVDVFARRLQLQERLTRQVAEAIDEVVAPRGVGVVMEARHLCVEMRGVAKINSDTVTSCLLGELRDDPAIRAQFSALLFTARDRGDRTGPLEL